MDHSKSVLAHEKISEHLKRAEYAVAGELFQTAQKRLKDGKEVIFTNIGNPHQLGQKPLTYIRHVMALVTSPDLMDHPQANNMFMSDEIDRARTYLEKVGGIGAYSAPNGAEYVRNEVADFIQRRDGYSASADQIFLTNGASEAARYVMRAMIRGPHDGILAPIPQYPLYSASVGLYDGTLCGYELHEESGWSLNMAELERAYNDAQAKGVTVRGMVFINPGNPTGNCLTYDNLVDLVKFCHERNIVILADEVYQENVYQSERPFVSMKKVLNDMGAPYSNECELISFHSISKGPYGECGWRGGYFELVNIDPRTKQEWFKLASINLCPTVPSQVIMGIMVNPPKPGEPSHELYFQEHGEILASMQRRARMITDTFNSMEGVVCQEADGAMYSFPRVHLPPGAIQAAKEAGKAPDVFYCLQLLEETGISTVPGSGFGQAEGTFHIRTTILPQEEKFAEVCEKLKSFHAGFMARFQNKEISENESNKRAKTGIAAI